MGFLELLTIIFVILKAFGLITWSWWLVFSPLFASIGIYIAIFVVFGLIFKKSYKDITKGFKK